MLLSNEHYLAAVEQFKSGQFKKSFLNLLKISNQYSNDLNFLRLLAQVQMSLKDFDAQIKTLRVLSDKTQNVNDKLKYMMALLSNGRRNESLDEAIALLSMSLANDQKKLVFKGLIRIYSAENDFEGLDEVCRELQKIGYEDAEVCYSQALLNASQGELDQAIEHLRRAVTLDPAFDTGWAALGLYHYKKGDVDLAKANLQKALDLNPVNTTALKHIANWADREQKTELEDALLKVNYYLQKFNFDEEISECHAKLLIHKGQTEFARMEIDKLSYYFGK